MSMETITRPPQEAQTTEHPYIERVPGVCGGEPKIRGTRIPVWIIAGWENMGLSVNEMVAMYPNVNAAQIYDALSYYYDHKSEVDAVRHQNSEAFWQPAPSPP